MVCWFWQPRRRRVPTYYEVTVTGVGYFTYPVSGSSTKTVLNNAYLIQSFFLSTLTRQELKQYTVAVNGSTEDLCVINKTTGAVEGTIFTSSNFTAQADYGKNDMYEYEVRDVQGTIGSTISGTVFYSYKNNIPSKLDFVVSVPKGTDDYGHPMNGTAIATGKSFTF
ncbi:MAG: hypothetical protein QM796_12180 [Chthoniobacteraceae bacterium]